MRRVTETQIKHMRASGYEAVVIEEALQDLERGKLADLLVEQIAEAFSGVQLGTGIGLHEARGLDDYEDEACLAAYRDSDEKLDWRKISAEDLCAFQSSLSFFDAQGMRFHLPAFMSAELRGEYGCGMISPLIRDGEYARYFSSLDAKQRQVVRQFLLFLLNDPHYAFERQDIERALDGYWSDK